MTRSVHLGTMDGAPFDADLDIILRSNVLVQANSGGGKSWLLRRFAEQAFGKVPQIIIDPEGEFATLRQQFDFVLVGKGGDTPADLRSAPLLAHRLLKLGASAVVDLFEMSKAQRPAWIAAFVQALVDAPKELWHDLLLHVDEAHEAAPEPGHGAHESREEKACRHALIDFAAKGRKRGYGVAAYTQRLGKLSKDFAAELKNVAIGQTFIDIDRERAAGNLGVIKTEKPSFFRNVKNIAPGHFYVLGRAFALEPKLVKIAGVETEHPTPGKRSAAGVSPPTAKIKHLLPQLADLPAEAEAERQTTVTLQTRIAELERLLAEAHGKVVTKTVPAFSAEDFARIENIADQLAQRQQVVVTELGNLRGAIRAATPTQDLAALTPADFAGPVFRRNARPISQAATTALRHEGIERANERATHMPLAELSPTARAILTVLASRGIASDAQVSALSGYRKTSSGFANALSELRAAGLITGDRHRREITDTGKRIAGHVPPPPTGAALLRHWVGKLERCEAALLACVHEHGTISRERLAVASGYSVTSSGFANAISALRTLELVDGPNGGDLTIAESFR